jgi:quinol monooxygenase YgiN
MANFDEGITVTLAVTLKPEVVDGFCAQLPEMIKDTASFKGFRSLRAVQHGTDRARFLMIEAWDSEADYAAYMDWRIRTGSLEAFKQSVVVPPQIDVWPVLAAKA